MRRARTDWHQPRSKHPTARSRTSAPVHKKTVSLVQMCNDTLERLKLTPRPTEGDARPVRYVGFLDAPGMPTHFVRLELAPDANPAFVAASLP